MKNIFWNVRSGYSKFAEQSFQNKKMIRLMIKK